MNANLLFPADSVDRIAGYDCLLRNKFIAESKLKMPPCVYLAKRPSLGMDTVIERISTAGDGDLALSPTER